MTIQISKFFKVSFVLVAVLSMFGTAYGEQAANPRGGNLTGNNAPENNVSEVASRTTVNRVVRNTDNVVGRSNSAGVSRSAVSRPSTTVSRSAVNMSSNVNNSVTGRSGTFIQNVVSAGGGSRNSSTARTASSNVISGVTHNPASTARAAASNSVVGLSRGASTARATAVFSDISAIGSGYAACREAYATCMDQFCANANDTYRRCICSARYDEFRNTENAIDEALGLLAQFEDNNLAVVGLSAEEVSAMYSATEGELAIKKDTSAAASMLSEINDLLSGKKSSSSSDKLSSASLGLLTIDFTSDLDDIWGSSGSSIFDTSTGVDLSTLTGEDLYSQANKQCLSLVTESCENDAVLRMAKSAYGIMITQDCNLYEKNINSQKESLEQTVRTAEKYLREARLEEYKSHNSADVNECIANVKNAIQSDGACGANYKRCLDYTGAYINQSTGEPIYSTRLFQLSDLIVLPGVNTSEANDILGVNADFNAFLESRRMFAETALDSCRDISDIVWEEFKRQALIEIAQAQDEKIEEVKMSCVSTMAECYDVQTGALQDFDNTTAQYTGAISAYAAREMCKDKVLACATLYGNTENCDFDEKGQLIVPERGLDGATANEVCGLSALLAFVDTVDTVRVSEGCETAVNNYIKDLCTPTSGSMGYPWNCRNMTVDNFTKSVNDFAEQTCINPANSASGLISQVSVQINRAITGMTEEMDSLMMYICENLGGYWVASTDNEGTLLKAFYNDVYGGDTSNTSWGKCVENSTLVQCLNYNETDEEPVASYNSIKDECDFTDEWYDSRCSLLGNGYYENGVCYVAQ